MPGIKLGLALASGQCQPVFGFRLYFFSVLRSSLPLQQQRYTLTAAAASPAAAIEQQLRQQQQQQPTAR
ncbi:hypothetical protein EAH_00004540 [Eimeria acervulina]|uniref:Uncharacterized protein n=1 Tax=Eimeria acervulina TaxID=5801 RepID=U6GFB9_EIMAC|nr:hypothetical protein EAH_00004540 [Eimeria acervulina]CDI77259.1 hypothetical protein EAH_00004540 [Eimeria acervulina]